MSIPETQQATRMQCANHDSNQGSWPVALDRFPLGFDRALPIWDGAILSAQYCIVSTSIVSTSCQGKVEMSYSQQSRNVLF
jgi:hypothetical protein